MTNAINGYINPFSDRFAKAIDDFKTLSLPAKIVTIALTVFTGLITLPLAGIGGSATFRLLVDRLKTTIEPRRSIIGPAKEPANPPKAAAETSEPIKELAKPVATVAKTSFISSLISGECTGSFYVYTNVDAVPLDYCEEFQLSLLREICLKDGSPLTLHSDDIIVECVFNNASPALKNSGFLTHLFILPISFLKTQGENGIYTIQYKGQTLKLRADQAHHPYKEGRVELDRFLDSAERILASKKLLPSHLAPTLSKNKHPFYTLVDGGVFYKLDNGRIAISEQSSLRPLQDPNKGWKITSSAGRITTGGSGPPSDADNVVVYQNALCMHKVFGGGIAEDLNIILTPTHLMVYGDYKDREIENPDLKFSNEIFIHAEWPRFAGFKDLSFEQMQEKMLEASVSLKLGQFVLSVPFEKQ